MKKTLFLLLLVAGFCAMPGFSQTVNTFFQNASSSDIALDKDGNVYVSNESSQIRKIWAHGNADTAFLTGGSLRRTLGLGFDPSGTMMYVACCPLGQTGWVAQVNTDGSNKILANGLNCPKDIAVDTAGNLYVTEGNSHIRKISPSGAKSFYLSGSAINTPLGIAWTPGDTLYVSSAHDGNIYQIIPGSPPTVKLFAHVNGLVQAWACGYMTYHNGYLYITNGDNKIHQISMQGVVRDFAGTGQGGYLDGPAASARFNAPNGICANEAENKIYVTEYNQNRVRVISDVSAKLESPAKWPVQEFSCFPNPASTLSSFHFDLKERAQVSLDIYDSQGKSVIKLLNDTLNPGSHSFEWDHVDSTGNAVPSGRYFGCLRVGDKQKSLQLELWD